MAKLWHSRSEPWADVAAEISRASGEPFRAATRNPLGGGCINTAFCVADGGRRYFVKLNSAEKLAMFEAEADGLREIASSASIRVPLPVCAGCSDGVSFLVLEYLDLVSCSGASCERMGQHLAAMHRHCAPSHGWRRDNTIGATPQPNAQSGDWIAFWRERRLGFQLRLACANRLPASLQRKGERLMQDLAGLFPGYVPLPSLLHGDLWGGNAGADTGGQPVLFDPAVYYGDREADLAMTELFGGFPARFLAAYREIWPTDPGYPVRRTLYNLYHILNHANLFGGGYAAQAEGMMDRLLAENG